MSDDEGLDEVTIEELAKRAAVTSIPIQNPALLPLEMLSPEVFEGLVAQLVHQQDNLSCAFYGRSGQKQHGLDIVERLQDDSSTLYQVKRFQEIDPAGIRDAVEVYAGCLLYTSPSPRDQRGSRMPSSA